MAIIKKTRYNKCWQGCGKKRAPVPAGGNITWFKTMGNSMEGPQKKKKKKIKMELPYDPAIPLFGVYPKEMKIGY